MAGRRRRGVRGIGGLATGGNIPVPPPDMDDFFTVSVWTGNGTAHDVTDGPDFAADGGMVWIKSRSSTAAGLVFDTLRGVQVYWQIHASGAEGTATGSLTAFNADGYSLGSQANVNASTVSYVGWGWKKAPGYFDVVTYTGNGSARTIAHSLGVKPGLILIKRRSATNVAVTYWSGVGATAYMLMNASAVPTTSSTMWNDTEPTASVFSVGTGDNVNVNGSSYVAYLWADGISDKQAVGKYTGNGSNSGPKITLGWKPQYILVKRVTGGTGNWAIVDTARGLDKITYANVTDAEFDGTRFTFDDDGFTIISNNDNYNANGSEYVYLAVRE